MTVNERQGSNGQTKAYYPELTNGLTHMRLHGLTPIHETDSAPDFLRPAWWASAACRGVDSAQATWFPDAADRNDKSRVARAIRICWSCPVRTECAAQGQQEAFGIWGGIQRDDDGLRRLRRAELRRRDRERKGAA